MSRDTRRETTTVSDLTRMEKALLAGNFSFLTTMDTADAVMEELEDKIMLLQSLQRTIKTQRNTLAPFHRLPNEVVSHIFRYCAPSLEITDQTTKRQFAFSQVCRAWRSVALNDPFVWANPIFEAPRVAELMLSRSRKTPLHIHITQKCSPLATTTRRGFLDHSRLQSVEIHCYRDKQAQDLFGVGAGPMPLLETLCLDIRQPGAFNWQDFKAPNLRTLRLRHVMPPGPSTMFSNLVELFVISYDRASFELASLQQVLRECTSLKRLGLCSALRYSRSGAASTGNETIDLPCLEHVLIEDRIGAAAGILSSLTAPQLSQISVYSGSEYTIHNIQPLIDLCTSIRGLVGTESHFDLALFTYSGATKEFKPLDHQPSKMFALGLFVDASIMKSALAILHDVLPLDRVRKLRFGSADARPDVSLHIWQRLNLMSFPASTTITTSDAGMIEKLNKHKRRQDTYRS